MKEGKNEGMEVAAQEEKLKKAEAETRGFLSRAFDSSNDPKQRSEFVVSELAGFLNSEVTSKYIDRDQVKQILESMRSAALSADKDEFISRCFDLLRPITELRVRHLKEYEDADALEVMKAQGFTPINERISYNIEGGKLVLHLAPSFEVKDQIEDLYKDALKKLVEVVLADPGIERIGGSSWINATKTYSAMKERLGFSISDTSEEVRAAHFADESRPIKDACMTREKFLQLYS